MLQVKEKKSSDSYIRIRVTEKEKEFVKEEASKRGLSITDFIKQSINAFVSSEVTK